MVALIERVRNGIRNLLGVRQKRKMPPVGTRPPVNTHISRGGLKMLVTHDLDDATWQWLALHGWRKITVPNDRRRYRRMPRQALKVLLRAPAEERDTLHQRMLIACKKKHH